MECALVYWSDRFFCILLLRCYRTLCILGAPFAFDYLTEIATGFLVHYLNPTQIPLISTRNVPGRVGFNLF